MSLRLELLQVARLAPRVLGDSTEITRHFLFGQINTDGGFKDRAGISDLYYTVFGLQGLAALDVQNPKLAVGGQEPGTGNHGEGGGSQSSDEREHGTRNTEHGLQYSSIIPQTSEFLRSFASLQGLDFVHLCCLARCWAAVSTGASTAFRGAILERLEGYRSADGGYNPKACSPYGTAYGAFLALGAYQDCGAALPDPLRLVQSLKTLETPDGAWTNERPPPHFPFDTRQPQGSTNATAAAVAVLRNLGQPLNSAVGDWLLARVHPQGGFRASPAAPMPDLLSTATALHALAGLEFSFARVKEPCLDFVDSLWTNEGGFYGHWGDDHLDCEYTFYGLLALGHLSL